LINATGHPMKNSYFSSMKKYSIALLFILFSVINKADFENLSLDMEATDELFMQLQLADLGLPSDAFQMAISGYRKLEAMGKLQNPSILTIIDFSQSSTKKRMYVIDLRNKTLLYNTYVAHGRNTGDEFATNFSNGLGTHKSSLGFYIAESIKMSASVGLSVLLQGVERGINDNAMKRAIIMHGAKYASEAFVRLNGQLGRSYGCPSVPPELIKPVSETIQGGTCLFIYYPSEQYLHSSQLI
jgi:hypothetical protein